MMQLRAQYALAVWMLTVCLAGCQSHPGRVWSVEERCGPADLAARSALQKNLPKVSFSGIALGDVVSFLRETSGVNFHVRWDMLRQSGIDQKTPVNVELADVTVEKVLRTILDDVGGVNPLGFIVDGGVVTITTREDISTRPIVRVYDVADLIGARNDEPGRTEGLINVIRGTVAPESWRGGEAAGTTGRVTVFQRKLVIAQTSPAHQRIALLLEALRERTPLASPTPGRPATEGKRITSTLAAAP